MGLKRHFNTCTPSEFTRTRRVPCLAAIEIKYGVTKFIGLDVGNRNLGLAPATRIDPILGSPGSPTHPH